MVDVFDMEQLIKQQTRILETYVKDGLSTLIEAQNFDKLSKGKTKFTDDLFPPNIGSIYTLKEDMAIRNARNDQITLKKNLQV